MTIDYAICPACTGGSRPIGRGFRQCDRCGGLLGNAAKPIATRYVAFDQPMQSNGDDLRYFDIYFTDAERRTHGWYDTQSRRVVQYG